MIKKIISCPYQLIHAIRSLIYDCGLVKRYKLPVCTIAIGNYSFGGTGKTPMTIFLAEYLARCSLRVAVLTRGYKSTIAKYPLILNSQDKNYPSGLGDEVLEMLSHFSRNNLCIHVAVDANRYRAGLELLALTEIDVFILDDGLQHLPLARDLNLLLINTQEQGYLRELPVLAKQKADYVIYTKADDRWIGHNTQSNVLKYKIHLRGKVNPDKPYTIMTAIGDPNSFISMVEQYLADNKLMNGKESIQKIIYKDHHNFSINEVTRVLSLGTNIICTAKDFVKIPEQYRDQIILAELELELIPETLLEEIYLRVTQ